MASCGTYIQAFIYIALLFFIIPIRINGPDEAELQFKKYLEQFNKSYDSEEYQTKLEAFKNSLQMIEKLNSNKTNGSAVYGLTKFSDMLPEEFAKKHLQLNLRKKSSRHKNREKRSEIPNFVDWRRKNVVTSVNNQGNCGACWAYAVVEVLESMSAIKNNKTEDLSVQEIIDCARNNNKGCQGGDICTLLAWMQTTNYVLHRKKDYHEKCNASGRGVQLQGFVCESFVGMEQNMLRLLAENGPLAVAINAQTWQNYIGGVIEYHCSGDFSALNHAVQIVGYDLSADIPHYIVRNTWGEDFGDGGYLYIAIGKNMCGVANEVGALTVI